MREIPSAGVTLRPEGPGDRAFLRALYGSVREPGDDAVWAAFVEQQFDLQSRHYRTSYPNAEFWIVEESGNPIGRIYLCERETEIRVLDIALLPHARGRGIGSALLRGVLAGAVASGRSVGLHVEAANPARRLYARLGFRDVDATGPSIFMECRP
jgi:ribosomal protein S18 acetylase RimI-like enzyme